MPFRGFIVIELILMAIKTNKAIKISQKHLLGIQDLSVNDINYILDESEAFIKLNQSKNKKIDVLEGQKRESQQKQLKWNEEINILKRENTIPPNEEIIRHNICNVELQPGICDF